MRPAARCAGAIRRRARGRAAGDQASASQTSRWLRAVLLPRAPAGARTDRDCAGAGAPGRQERSQAGRRPQRAGRRSQRLRPDCFVEIPATGVCGMCGERSSEAGSRSRAHAQVGWCSPPHWPAVRSSPSTAASRRRRDQTARRSRRRSRRRSPNSSWKPTKHGRCAQFSSTTMASRSSSDTQRRAPTTTGTRDP